MTPQTPSTLDDRRRRGIRRTAWALAAVAAAVFLGFLAKGMLP